MLRSVAVVGDGARWIWKHVVTTFGSERVEILDWYHCCQHLWAVGAAVHGVGTPETAAWLDQAKDLLWERGPSALLDLLATLQAPTDAAAKVLATERGYFRSNVARMHYATYRQQDLPIGSDAVESAAKHLVQQRMKRAGMGWSELGARAVLDLRCALLNAAILDRVAELAPEVGVSLGGHQATRS